MRDLASRLREIVQRPHGAPAVVPPRELTYVAEGESMASPRHVVDLLGGTPVGVGGACIAIDRLYESHRSHGRRSIDAFRPVRGRPIDLFDRRVARDDDWTRHVVFFDTETTGLAVAPARWPFSPAAAGSNPTGFASVSSF